MEEWKSIECLNGRYEVSNTGRIRNKKGQELKPHIGKTGYYEVSLTDESGYRKPYKMHRLVAMAFIDNPDNLPCINHKDETRTNNRVENLEWCTVKYNNNYGNHGKHIAESLCGRQQTQKWRDAILKAVKGVPKSEEHRKNLSIAKSGVEVPRAWKRVICVETNLEYESVKSAAKAHAIKQANISRALHNGKTAAGYHWKFAD